MTYPDDVLKAAREAVAKDCEERARRHTSRAIINGYLANAADYRSGKFDKSIPVRVACIAIMAERQRCAGIARAAKGPLEGKDTLFPEEVAQWESCEEIEQAILGQQEPKA